MWEIIISDFVHIFCLVMKAISWFQTVCLLSRSVMFDSLQIHGLQPTILLCLWNFPGKNTGVGCHFLFQGIFQTQGSNLYFLHGQVDSLLLVPPGKQVINDCLKLNDRDFPGGPVVKTLHFRAGLHLEFLRKMLGPRVAIPFPSLLGSHDSKSALKAQILSLLVADIRAERKGRKAVGQVPCVESTLNDPWLPQWVVHCCPLSGVPPPISAGTHVFFFSTLWINHFP